ncbi:DUF2812 domain-containing protein [Anaerotignum sp. MB30-C6]|uniref:DUF2812 domain-containing protein n=1 Tax=Anaerotignum sp. MB30-C6 TaxID=3070814 RepID=UPI0027DE3552|nr:DUF2812 domain-containing protein [Anaerotignum sp. MB30-C6]WMI80475.1 DUF2812 domain-containing protein [Anaerotignum sp. MB30-C6]
MNQSCIRLFSFRPENYHQMAHYLNEMLEKGWRLRWCKGTLAGFERADNNNLHYIVDPYPISSLLNFKKFPKYRLNEYMENGWYAVGKSKGCYIFCSDDENPERPSLEENMKESIIKTCYKGSLVFAIILLILLVKSFTTPAILYSILLTDFYILLCGLVLFLISYHFINAILLVTQKKQSTNNKRCKRYLIHDVMLFFFLILGILLQARHETFMLRYLLLPIFVVGVGSIILMVVSKRAKTAKESNKRLTPVICMIGVVLLILIPLSVQRLQESSLTNKRNRAQELLTSSHLFPVAHLKDFVPVPTVKNAIKENNSILGVNTLYAEEHNDLSVFTNFTKMKSSTLAKPIFNYLLIQTEKEQQANFQENTFNGVTYYSLEKTNTILCQIDHVVYLCTTPSSISKEQVLELLLSYSL